MMAVAFQDRPTTPIPGLVDQVADELAAESRPAGKRRVTENSPRRLILDTWVLALRLLRRWGRDPATVLESLLMPVVLLVTLNIVLGKGISDLTGHSALYRTVPLIAMVGAMSGSMIGGTGLMREREDGLLARLWVVPVHRASGLLSRLLADSVRIVVTTLVVLAAGVILGFRFQMGPAATVAWVLVPITFGVAFTMFVIGLALYAQSTIVVEATEVVWGMLMFFSTGFVPLDQYPHWIQPVVKHQPMSYVIETMYGLAFDGPIAIPLIGTLAWSVGLAAVCVVPMAIGYRRASMHG